MSIIKPKFIDDDEMIKYLELYFYGVIYKLTNVVNKKIYIGKTKTKNFINYITNSYFRQCGNNRRSIIRAAQKHGATNFLVDIIDLAYSAQQLNELKI